MEQSNESKAILVLNWNWNFRLIDILTWGHYSYSFNRRAGVWVDSDFWAVLCSVTQKSKVSRFYHHHRPRRDQRAVTFFCESVIFIHGISSHLILNQWEGHRWGTLTSLLNQLYDCTRLEPSTERKRSYIKTLNSRHTAEIQWNEEKQSIDYVWNVFIQFFLLLYIYLFNSIIVCCAQCAALSPHKIAKSFNEFHTCWESLS